MKTKRDPEIAILLYKTEVKKKCKKHQGCYTMIKRSIHQENIITENIYAPSIGASKYIKQISEERNSTTIIKIEIKRCMLLEITAVTNLDSVLKQRYHFAYKGPYSQSCGFSSSLVWM